MKIPPTECKLLELMRLALNEAELEGYSIVAIKITEAIDHFLLARGGKRR